MKIQFSLMIRLLTPHKDLVCNLLHTKLDSELRFQVWHRPAILLKTAKYVKAWDCGEETGESKRSEHSVGISGLLDYKQMGNSANIPPIERDDFSAID
ncbi:MAG TPA: hypothetical protein DD706_16715 [Nitrospiraceae bacterium]|nr:hypothetical protein [Nitrospiraceae bacterium]